LGRLVTSKLKIHEKSSKFSNENYKKKGFLLG
jgi:hypothetical protein